MNIQGGGKIRTKTLGARVFLLMTIRETEVLDMIREPTALDIRT
jgi:hypothetical protein